ncbi:MAG: energy-coupled thiamine transporter ThiT [Clostridia bacterium]|nr:energy-coupled thiamine transporter ThiT [Clostridia bacterium]
MNQNVKRLTLSAMMLALATVLALVCAYIPFLNLPFGGGFTVASMLPIVIVAYMYGVKWGTFTAFCYSLIQIILSLTQGSSGTVMALFLPSSDDFMGYAAAIWIVLIDYLIAYTVLGFGGVFRNRIKSKTAALVLGVVVALSLRYLCHVVSGYIFYGAWAEWFFTQDGFYAIGNVIMGTFEGQWLSLIYSVFYNGLFMIPEIIITAIVAVPISQIPAIKKEN